MSPFLLSVVAAMVIISFTHWIYRWYNPPCKGKLPPGSMGWPILGETRHFFTPYTSFDIQPFIKQRMIRYGPLFKTSIVAKAIIVSTDPELNHIIFQQEGQSFQSSYPNTFTEIFGQKKNGSIDGFMHKYLKNMVLNLFGPESLKKMISEVEEVVLKHLNYWYTMDTVELRDATAAMIFNFTAKKLISHDTYNSSEDLRENYIEFMKGLISFPLNIPGTAYHKCLQGRKKAMKTLKNLMHERKKNPRKNNEDFFDYVLEELSKEQTILTEEIALDLMFALLFASYETTSLALTLAIKYLTDYPLVLQTLVEEQEEVCARREVLGSHLSWKDYKSMNFTFKFINETLRHANIAPVIFRKALRDVSFKGFTIPAGWAIMVCPPAVHLNPAIYEDPLEINPWRWEGGEMNGASKHFMAFGGGMRFCIGADFSKVQMCVFLHYFVTKYRWKTIKGGNMLRTPGLQFPDGFHVRLADKSLST